MDYDSFDRRVDFSVSGRMVAGRTGVGASFAA